ncbi:MAG: ATP-binding protein [Candidatus Kapabacteria bacterium]|nr:ATP-binding protein [Candidatus Kapabacteria bacterium]
MNNPEIKLIITSNFDNVSLIGVTVHQLCKYFYDDEAFASEIEIGIVEACNNVIEHSYLAKDNQDIEMSLKFFKDKLNIRLSDYGIFKDKRKKPKLDYDPDDIDNLPEGGMGLFLIYNIMDELSYSRSGGKNTLSMTKNISDK